jgi:hypothetical protein
MYPYLRTYQRKVKLSRYTPWRRMGERRHSSYSYLTSATRWGWVVSVTPRPRFTPGERTPDTHWVGGWVGLTAGLDAGARRKILCPCRGSNFDHPIVQPVVRHYTVWATAAHSEPTNVCIYTQVPRNHSNSWYSVSIRYSADVHLFTIFLKMWNPSAPSRSSATGNYHEPLQSFA